MGRLFEGNVRDGHELLEDVLVPDRLTLLEEPEDAAALRGDLQDSRLAADLREEPAEGSHRNDDGPGRAHGIELDAQALVGHFPVVVGAPPDDPSAGVTSLAARCPATSKAVRRVSSVTPDSSVKVSRRMVLSTCGS